MAGDLRNKPEREEAFKDWGLGIFVHWSFDSQLGSVISHSMDYASRDYLDRYVNELPKTFNPKKLDPDEWMEIAKLAGTKYMVLTAKHHNGFCMWDTKTTDFNIMNTAYGKDIVRQYVDACRRHGLKVGFYYSPEDFAFHYERDIPARGARDGRKYYDELVAYTIARPRFARPQPKSSKEAPNLRHVKQRRCVAFRKPRNSQQRRGIILRRGEYSASSLMALVQSQRFMPQ